MENILSIVKVGTHYRVIWDEVRNTEYLMFTFLPQSVIRIQDMRTKELIYFKKDAIGIITEVSRSLYEISIIGDSNDEYE